MTNEPSTSKATVVTRETLMLYHAGGLSEAEKAEVRRAVANDPRLAACCQEEESLDKCIERCLKKETPSNELKNRIRACLEAAQAGAPAPAPAKATAAKIVPLPMPAPAVYSGRRVGLSRVALIAAAVLLAVVGGLWWQTQPQVPSVPMVAGGTSTATDPAPKHVHEKSNLLDSLLAGYESHPTAEMPGEAQVQNIVHTVGLQALPHGGAIQRVVSLRGIKAPGNGRNGIKVCFECPGKQTWNLTILQVSPELIAAMKQHDCRNSQASKRTYYMCGDKTGKHPCAVFWQDGDRIVALIAETPSAHLVEIADEVEF